MFSAFEMFIKQLPVNQNQVLNNVWSFAVKKILLQQMQEKAPG